MPFIPDPCLPPIDHRLETAIQIAEFAIDIAERLVTENAELKRCLVRKQATGRRRPRAKQPA